MEDFKGKRVVITGGAGDIGRATARLFLGAGAQVLLVDLKEDALAKVRQELGSERCFVHAADVTKTEAVRSYVAAAQEQMGGIDVFFNNAGIEGPVQPIVDYPEEDFHQVLHVNVLGVWLGLKYVMRAMTEAGSGGSIICTSSVAGQSGSPGVSAYVASKHAVVGLMRVAALEGAAAGIRVNTIHPSPVDGRMMNSLESGMGDAAEVEKQLKASIPLGRYATQEDVANLVLFLASEERAGFLTGGEFNVDGGMSAK